MIDINKYEGHTEGPWKNKGGDIYAANGERIADTVLEMTIPQDEAYANTFLIADAPLLLAGYKLLRKQLVAYMDFLDWVQEEHNEVFDEYERKGEL